VFNSSVFNLQVFNVFNHIVPDPYCCDRRSGVPKRVLTSCSVTKF
jgi:adenosylcobinamide amidohydrolase